VFEVVEESHGFCQKEARPSKVQKSIASAAAGVTECFRSQEDYSALRVSKGGGVTLLSVLAR
jgi:hypothetical protein